MTDRFVAGTVLADGTVSDGTGFTVQHIPPGHYDVLFEPEFTTIFGGSVTQVFGRDGDTRDNAVLIEVTNTRAFVKTGDSNGKATDRGFTFIFAGSGSGGR